ncbi:MAG: NAD-dependent epimerase/dehydratase family protein [Coriobacteriia bacterium]
MRVLVTGGAGFIGSNLVRLLIGAGHETGVIDDLSTGRVDNLHPASWFRRLDILDPTLATAVAEFAPEAVVHLAAQVSVGESLLDPVRDRLVNVEGTRAVARAAADAGVRRVLSASSAAVYGEPATVPLPETAPKRPENPYGESKLAAEGVLAEELRPRGVDFASLRFANVYGPRQDWRGEGGVVAIFAGRMALGENPVVFGSGEQTRDFVYVGDVGAAVFSALEWEGPLAAPGDDGPAYNVSTGEEISVETLTAHLRAAARFARPIEHAPARAGDIERSALDPGKARKTFGWSAAVGLPAGLELTVRWFAEHR